MRIILLATSALLATAVPAFPGTAQTAPSADCQGSYYIFFDPNSDSLSPSAQAVLSEVANAYRSCGQLSVSIMGHADRSTQEDESVGLSQRMANAARDYMESLGFPGGVMTTMAFGETRPAFETEDGVSEPLNRRVEIIFGPGSGW